MLSLVSTWMGDRLGTLGAVGIQPFLPDNDAHFFWAKLQWRCCFCFHLIRWKKLQNDALAHCPNKIHHAVLTPYITMLNDNISLDIF